jgi:hypothetical protein
MCDAQFALKNNQGNGREMTGSKNGSLTATGNKIEMADEMAGAIIKICRSTPLAIFSRGKILRTHINVIVVIF